MSGIFYFTSCEQSNIPTAMHMTQHRKKHPLESRIQYFNTLLHASET